MRPFVLLLAFAVAGPVAGPVAAQHQHHAAPAADTVKTFVVHGLRVDAEAPPPGSGVGRAGARLPGGGYLHVVYGKPYTRGRDVFGEVVPFGKVWVTGAHYATELAVTVPVTVGGQALAPGIYTLFTTPRPDRWTLHLNRALGMHLADEYDPAEDVLTVEVVPSALEAPVPGLTIDFVPAGTGVDLRIRWDRTGVQVPIRPR